MMRGLRRASGAEPPVVGRTPDTPTNDRRTDTMKTYILRQTQPVQPQKLASQAQPQAPAPGAGTGAAPPPGPQSHAAARALERQARSAAALPPAPAPGRRPRWQTSKAQHRARQQLKSFLLRLNFRYAGTNRRQ